MSKYTTMVSTICEVNAGLDESVGYNGVNEVIEKSRGKIFNFPYPIFDESYKKVLETKILKHYYTREIGLETVGLWKLKLDTKLNEIMPFYNQLYKSELLDFNPFYDVDMERTHNRKGDTNKNEFGDNTNTETQNGSVNATGTQIDTGNQTTDTTSKSDTSSDARATNHENSQDTVTIENTNTRIGESENANTGTVKTANDKKDKYAETPQGTITNLENDGYLTNARIVEDENTVTNNLKNVGKENVKDTSIGNSINKNESDSVSTNHADDVTNTTGNSNTDTSFNSNTTNDTFTSNSRNGSSTSSINSTVTSLEDYIEHVKGKQGGKNYSEMLQDFRNTFLNIDMQVISELSDLFMNIW